MIEEKQKEGWQFVFLGVGIDAYAEAMKMGIQSAGRSGSRAGGMSMASMATKCFMSGGDTFSLLLHMRQYQHLRIQTAILLSVFLQSKS